MKNATQKTTEKILIIGDKQTLFSDLINKHYTRLYNFIDKYIDHEENSADLAQQACIIAFESLRPFRSDSELSNWLQGIAFNLVRSYFRDSAQCLSSFEDKEILLHMPSNEIDLDFQINLTETLSAVQFHLDALPLKTRTVLKMFTIDEMPIEEIAEAMHIPKGTVKSRIFCGRALLASALKNSGIEIF